MRRETWSWPANLSIVRRFILNILKLDTTHPKRSVSLRTKVRRPG